ncbi:MAG: tetratricopeptide repeat protein [Phycisphaerae bacterium]
MSQLTTSQLLFIARQHFAAGRWSAAEDLAQRVLAANPREAAALHLLGLIASRTQRSETAITLLRRAVEITPENSALLQDLATLYQTQKRTQEALGAYRQAIALEPANLSLVRALATLCHESHAYPEAAALYRQILAQEPGAGDILVALGDVLWAQNLAEEALDAYRRARAGQLGEAGLYRKIGAALLRVGQLEEALAALRQAVDLDPDDSIAWHLRGAIELHQGRWEEAMVACRRALSLNSTLVESFLNLGDALLETGQPEPAVATYRQALALRPDDHETQNRAGGMTVGADLLRDLIAQKSAGGSGTPETAAGCFELGRLHHEARDLDAAAACYRRALELDPSFVLPVNNLAMVRKDQGLAAEAIELLRGAVQLDPHLPALHSNLVYTMHLPAQADGEAILREHRAWNVQHAAGLRRPSASFPIDPTPKRRLRIGYVSPDFCAHPVGRFLLALFAAHDHAAFEIFCYASVRQPDRITAQLRAGADRWVNAIELSDEALAERIRADRIDILVDLTMHMARNRLLTFARKPAPIQITYLAYCSTTGLDAMDYRITDPYLDPLPASAALASSGNLGLERPPEFTGPSSRADAKAWRCHARLERDRRFYSERSVYLPETYWCYQPPEGAPEINALPALSRGYVTFASFNNFCKVMPETLELWKRVLLTVPRSRLLIHAYPGSHRQRVRDLFGAAGIAMERLDFFDRLTLPLYLRLHHAIDIALDPYPHGGGTTTCDALWMGVPTVSLVGPSALSRGGLSILSNVGLSELATPTPAEYLRSAVELANDLPRLATWRAEMRERLRASPLTNGARFAKNLECLYRSLFDRHL